MLCSWSDSSSNAATKALILLLGVSCCGEEFPGESKEGEVAGPALERAGLEFGDMLV